MAEVDFVDRLSEMQIPLAQILLDPNNPRLIGLDGYTGVPETRINEPQVQERTLERLNSVRSIDQEALRASILQSGLLPVDRIVVRPIITDGTSNQIYVVVEGNRRIAACKTLVALHEAAEKTLTPRVLASISDPSVLVLAEDKTEEARLDQWVIQGVRHISGIKPWGAYQAAKTIEAMLDKLGYSESEVANTLSISIQRVRRSARVLAAIRQMAESDDYAEFATPETYAYFDELLKRPAIRNWLGWSNDSNSFENDERLEQVYTWMTPDDELDGRSRLPVAESVRKLDGVLEDPAALEVMNTPGRTVDDAAAAAAPNLAPDWTEPILRATKALDAVPIGDLENLSEENEGLIKALVELGQKRLDQASKFRP